MCLILEDDVQTVLRLDEADVLDDIVVVQVLEEVDLGLTQCLVSDPCSFDFQIGLLQLRVVAPGCSDSRC